MGLGPDQPQRLHGIPVLRHLRAPETRSGWMVRLKEGWVEGGRGGGKRWRDMRRGNSTGRGGGRAKVTLFITALLEKYFSWSSFFLFW